MLVWIASVSLASAQQGSSSFGTVTPLTTQPNMTAVPSLGTNGATTPSSSFDAYSQPGGQMNPPSLLPSNPTPYGGTSPGLGTPYYTPPSAPATYGTPPAYQGFGTTNPPVLFPGAGQTNPGTYAYASTLKLFQNARLSHAWLAGDSTGDNLRINDTFLSSTLAFPNFMWSGQPWFVQPGFALHLWSGPFDDSTYIALPSKAYSAFVDIGFKSDPNRVVGVEAAGRFGLYSDFNSVDNESFRPGGLLLLRYNLTPNLAMKAGVDYINRASYKLLPAGGFLWTPNPQTRWDIYFPNPKLASYLTTLGNHDLWWYISGEYGGGVWTVTLDDSDPTLPGQQPARVLMDINDFRAMVGVELLKPGNSSIGQHNAFFEVGYVWNREVIIAKRPGDFNPSATFMLRGGLAF